MPLLGSLVACSALACSGAPDELTAEPRPPETAIDATITVSRVDSGDAATAQAMAHFASGSSERPETLIAAGLARSMPSVGSCELPLGTNEASFATFGEVQLLDVGEVTISVEAAPEATPPAGDDIPDGPVVLDGPVVPDGPVVLDGPGAPDDVGELPQEAEVSDAPQLVTDPVSISLAPRAFPSISSFASGVVYTSRDRSSDALPSGASYLLEVAGGDHVPSFTMAADAPRRLRDVTLGGEPLSLVERIAVSRPLDVTWGVEPAAAGDTVVVELADADDGAVHVRCVFADDIGAATISSEWLAGLRGSGKVLLHRQRALRGSLSELRTDGSAGPPNGTVRLTFDFETSIGVEFVD